MALLLAEMATRELLRADLVTVRDFNLTRRSGCWRDKLEPCLATWAMSDNIGREWAVSGSFILRVTRPLTRMMATVKLPPADVNTRKRTLKPGPGAVLVDELAVIK